ncbi:MAG: hypothetical protein ACREJS_06320 [Candidatus Rokuibacteriota bacterium]
MSPAEKKLGELVRELRERQGLTRPSSPNGRNSRSATSRWRSPGSR